MVPWGWNRRTARLSRVLPTQSAGAILGDVLEEYADRLVRRGRWRAEVWLVGELSSLRRAYRGSALGPRIASGGWRVRPLDVAQALRALRRSPWYAATTIAVTALGIVMMATVFSVVDGVLFRPLPYPSPDEIFAVSGTFEGEPAPERLVGTVSPREVNAWRASVPDLPLTLLGYTSIILEDGSFAMAATVDRDFFDVFGVRLLVGGFAAEDFAQEQPVRGVLLSYRLWQTHFNGDPDAVGRVVTPHGFRTRPFRIAGILDVNGFVPPLPGPAESWVRHQSRIDVLMPETLPPTFGERGSIAFVRVPAGRAGSAEFALRSAVATYRAKVPPPQRPYQSDGQRRAMAPYDDVSLVPIDALVKTRQRPVLSIAFATAAGLTLLVLLNAGALAAARSQQRVREFAVRRSLGARPRDLLRSAIVEQGLLILCGTALGLSFVSSMLRFVERALPPGLELIKSASVDWRTLAFAGFVAVVMTLVIALMSVRLSAKHAALKSVLSAGAGAGRSGTWLGRLLVAAQVALGFVLVLAGALFLRSLDHVWGQDPGLRMRNAAMLRVSLTDFVDYGRRQHIIDGVRAVPGVAGAGAFEKSIFASFAGDSGGFQGPDGGPPPGQAPSLMRIGSGFLAAAGMTLVSGRLPSDAELDAGAPVIAVTETLAARYWPGEHAIGRTLRSGRTDSRVVGVLRDARLVAMDVAPAGTIFAPLSPRAAGMHVFVAFADRVDAALARIVARVPEIDSIARVTETRMVEDAAAESVRPRTISAFAASGFAIGSLILIGVALFGLAAQTTAWRTREMGIRLALGDTPAGVIALVAAGHALTVAAGLVAGSLLAAAVVRTISTYLYGVTAYDAVTWALAAGVIVAVAALGALVPALRAGAVDPVDALRSE